MPIQLYAYSVHTVQYFNLLQHCTSIQILCTKYMSSLRFVCRRLFPAFRNYRIYKFFWHEICTNVRPRCMIWKYRCLCRLWHSPQTPRTLLLLPSRLFAYYHKSSWRWYTHALFTDLFTPWMRFTLLSTRELFFIRLRLSVPLFFTFACHQGSFSILVRSCHPIAASRDRIG